MNKYFITLEFLPIGLTAVPLNGRVEFDTTLPPVCLPIAMVEEFFCPKSKFEYCLYLKNIWSIFSRLQGHRLKK